MFIFIILRWIISLDNNQLLKQKHDSKDIRIYSKLYAKLSINLSREIASILSIEKIMVYDIMKIK